MFGSDIRVFVPQLAMSGGTLLALSGKEIWMGNHSNLEPIDGMLKDDPDKEHKSSAIAKALTNVQTHKQHGRHIHKEDCKAMGLNIKDLESDDKLQDFVLSVHHAFSVTLSNTPAAKIIENHNGAAFVKNASAGNVQLRLQQ
jgi:hypothetical protein